MRTKMLLTLMLGSWIWIGCNKLDRPRPDNGGGCFPNKPGGRCGVDDSIRIDDPVIDCEGVVCTKQFVSVPLIVVDKLGNAVVLDSFYTADNAGARLTADLYNYDNISNTYTVINDMWVAGHQQTNVTVRFVGYKNGVKVVNEPYIISTDCCHIAMTSGKNKMIIP